MDKHTDQKRAVQYLYPPIDPFDQRMMDVGQGHRIYVEQCGNPKGIPVVVLHGGPGGGCSPVMRRYFDLEVYRVILFDQRGCGRSTPHASVTNNTTWHLVDDIEAIRTSLEIDAWCVFGGSWGATLSLIYAQAHPDRTTHLILRGVFLMTRTELENKMAVLLGGRAAEWVVYHHLSTGAADDLAKVTDIARAMVTRYGMSETLGQVALERDRRSFLSPEDLTGMPRPRDFSDVTAAAIDAEVGAMDSNFDEAQVARAMIGNARSLILVAARPKFGRKAAFRVCGLDEVDVVVTDAPPGAIHEAALRAAGAELI